MPWKLGQLRGFSRHISFNNALDTFLFFPENPYRIPKRPEERYTRLDIISDQSLTQIAEDLQNDVGESRNNIHINAVVLVITPVGSQIKRPECHCCRPQHQLPDTRQEKELRGEIHMSEYYDFDAGDDQD